MRDFRFRSRNVTISNRQKLTPSVGSDENFSNDLRREKLSFRELCITVRPRLKMVMDQCVLDLLSIDHILFFGVEIVPIYTIFYVFLYLKCILKPVVYNLLSNCSDSSIN